MGQSGSFETASAAGAAVGSGEPPPDEEPEEDEPEEDDSVEPTGSLASVRLVLDEVDFSFRAQPVPLK
jgi:hypothetical protein